MTPKHSQQAGFSLPLALMLVGAMAGAALLASTGARSNLRTAIADVELAQAEALADAGVVMALIGMEKVRSGPPAARPPNGPSPRLWCRPDGTKASLKVVIEDEGGKVDLNYAGAPLLTALIAGLGVDRVKAQALASALIDFRDTDEETSPNGAESPEYEAAGLPYGPRNEPFRDIVEVRAVLGMTAEIADRMAPYVTVHSGSDGIDPAVASPELIALIARGDAATGYMASSEDPLSSQPDDRNALPARFAQPSQRRYYAISAQAIFPTTRYMRKAIVDIGTLPAALAIRNPRATALFRFWTWRREAPSGARFADGVLPEDSNALPRC